MKKILFIALVLIGTIGHAQQLELPFGVKVNNRKPLNYYYYKDGVTPYADVAEVNSTIPISVRYRGMTALVDTVEYWYMPDTLDINLKIKTAGGGGSYTFSNGLTESGDTVKLGGALIEATEIEGDGNALSLGTATSKIGTLDIYSSDNVTINVEEEAKIISANGTTFVVADDIVQILLVDTTANIQFTNVAQDETITKILGLDPGSNIRWIDAADIGGGVSKAGNGLGIFGDTVKITGSASPIQIDSAFRVISNDHSTGEFEFNVGAFENFGTQLYLAHNYIALLTDDEKTFLSMINSHIQLGRNGTDSVTLLTNKIKLIADSVVLSPNAIVKSDKGELVRINTSDDIEGFSNFSIGQGGLNITTEFFGGISIDLVNGVYLSGDGGGSLKLNTGDFSLRSGTVGSGEIYAEDRLELRAFNGGIFIEGADGGTTTIETDTVRLSVVPRNSDSAADILLRDATTGTIEKLGIGSGLSVSDGNLISTGGFSDPMTTRGDIIYRNSSNATARLGAGTAGQVLTSDGTDIAWATPSGSGDVVGPASAVNNRVVFFDGTTGKLIKDSGLTLSGSNTGDQTITLTGDVTGSGTGSFAATIANDAVTYAKIQNVTDNRLLGRSAGSSGDVQEITIGSGLTLSGGSLSASGGSGIGGSTGSTDNALLRADGTGGSTAQASSVIISDNADVDLGVAGTTGTTRTMEAKGSASDISISIVPKGTFGSVFLGSSGQGTQANGTFYAPIGIRTNQIFPGIISAPPNSNGQTLLIRGGDGNGTGIAAPLYLGFSTGNSGQRGNIGIAQISNPDADPYEIDFEGMRGGLFIQNRQAAPSDNPTGGAFLSVDNGMLETLTPAGATVSLSGKLKSYTLSGTSLSITTDAYVGMNILCTSGSAVTITIGEDLSLESVFTVTQWGAGTVTLVEGSDVNIVGKTATTGQGDMIWVYLVEKTGGESYYIGR